MDFVAIDVLNDPRGRERLLELGVRNVPVVAKGDQFVFGQNLEDVAEFVGLHGTGHTPLPPDALIGKWMNVLRAGQRYVRQVPNEHLNERVIPNRDRSIRLMSHHLFRIAEAFLETVVDGAEYGVQLANIPPEDGAFLTGEEIARYGGQVIARLEGWWVHQLFERSTWHSAQHARQLVAVLERLGVEPDGRLTPEDLAGLPLPERLWE
ncbi:MAG: hypothetical protein HYY79_03060 [Betaproteobacteria bacterium]|nr:hypothetical protein [Betaproteobacteria bacterium]